MGRSDRADVMSVSIRESDPQVILSASAGAENRFRVRFVPVLLAVADEMSAGAGGADVNNGPVIGAAMTEPRVAAGG
jgi:hypothetical protein